MTRRKHRKQKKQNLEQKNTHQDICNERPEWANDEKVEIEDKNWLANFKAEVKAAIQLRDLKGSI